MEIGPPPKLAFALDEASPPPGAAPPAAPARRRRGAGRPVSTAWIRRNRSTPPAATSCSTLCEDFARQLTEARFDYERAAPLRPSSRLGAFRRWRAASENPRTNGLHWSPPGGLLRATCLDPSRWIAGLPFRPTGGSILMSAPRALRGLPSQAAAIGPRIIPCVALGRRALGADQAYSVAVDLPDRTTRPRPAGPTTKPPRATVAALANQSPGTPVAVFFSSSYQ